MNLVPFLWILLFLACPSLRADAAGTGTTAGTFVKLGTGSRAIALGEAYVAVSGDSETLSYNPAGIADSYSRLELTHNLWFEGAASDHLSGLINLGGAGSIGANLNYLSIPSEESSTQVSSGPDPEANFQSLGAFNPYDAYGTLSYAYLSSRSLALGASLKVTAQDIDGNLGVGFGLDLGAIYDPDWHDINIGLSVQNLGFPVSLVQEEFSLPEILRLGATERFGPLLISGECDFPDDSQYVLAGGLEYGLGQFFYPRLGIRMDGIFNPWSAGFGINLGDLTIDFATVPYDELGQTYRASLAYVFGRTPELNTTPAPSSKLPYQVTLLEPKSPKNADDPETFVAVPVETTLPEEVKSWAFYIYSSGPHPSIIYRHSSEGALPDELIWFGENNEGRLQGSGSYPGILVVQFKNGKTLYSNYVHLQISKLLQ